MPNHSGKAAKTRAATAARSWGESQGWAKAKRFTPARTISQKQSAAPSS